MKELFHGQEFSDGVRKRRSKVFTLHSPADVSSLPTSFSTEEFGDMFRLNFANSTDIGVYGISNYIYKFTIGLEDFASEKTTGPWLVMIF